MLRLSIRQLAKQLQSGEISATELCRKCQDRAILLQDLNALTTPTFTISEENARESDARIKAGEAKHVLDGIPFAVKDNFSTAGVGTTCASKMLENYIPPYTATVVDRLQQSGAVLMGKTNLDEFAMGAGCTDSIFGPTRNPWGYPYNEPNVKDGDWFISGGSSGGSAVAVATGIVAGALGSDTGGSSRVPAALCGIIGLKPTYGLCSRNGLIPLVNSLDVPSVFARSVDDASIILGAIAGEDPLDATTVPRPPDAYELPEEISVQGLRVGIPQEYHSPQLQDDVLRSWSMAADMLENAGAEVIPVSLPHTQYSIACYSVLCAVEVASNMARYDGIEYGHRGSTDSSTEALYASSRHEGFNEVVRGRIFAGNYFTLRRNYEEFFQRAMRVRRLVKADFDTMFCEEGIDILLTPTTVCSSSTYEAFKSLDNRSQCENIDVFTQPSNLAGVPALSLPASLASNGLPIGLQLIAPRFHDRKLLTIGKWMEQRLGFPSHELLDLLETLGEAEEETR